MHETMSVVKLPDLLHVRFVNNSLSDQVPLELNFR